MIHHLHQCYVMNSNVPDPWSAKWTVSVSLPVAVSVANMYKPKLVQVFFKKQLRDLAWNEFLILKTWQIQIS